MGRPWNRYLCLPPRYRLFLRSAPEVTDADVANQTQYSALDTEFEDKPLRQQYSSSTASSSSSITQCARRIYRLLHQLRYLGHNWHIAQ